MAEKKQRVREYVFNPGIIPSDRGNVHQWHGHARDGTTTREAFVREDGRWVIRWTFTHDWCRDCDGEPQTPTDEESE
jgi:hypothetical protein